MQKRLAALLFLTLPAVSHTILIHGHRGARTYRPENTIPAFVCGIQHGDDVLELDLAVTKDNQLVVSHSPFLIQPEAIHGGFSIPSNERICVGPPRPAGTLIHSLTLAEIKQYDCGSKTLANFPNQVAVPGTKIPTFDEVLDLAPMGHFDFNVETKSFPSHPEMTPAPEVFVKMIADAVRRHGLVSRVILQSFDFRTLHAMKQLNPAIRLSALFGPTRGDAIMGITDHDKSFAHIAEVAGLRPGDFLSPDQSLVTPEEVATAHNLKLQVAPYTADTPAGWKRLADARVDAIITDDPTNLLAWLRSQNPPLHP